MISRSPGTNKKGAICIAPFGFPLFSLISTEHFQYPAFWYTSIRTELIDDDKIGPLFIEELLYPAVETFRTSQRLSRDMHNVLDIDDRNFRIYFHFKLLCLLKNNRHSRAASVQPPFW
jgi:hypothetical protein